MAFSSTTKGAWLRAERLRTKLKKAFAFFYPDADNAGFTPDVVDFFSALRTYLDIGAGLVGTGFRDAPDLYRLLRLGIAHLLIERVRSLEDRRLLDHKFLNEMIKPGHIIITSNWDPLIEHFAWLKGYPLRLASSGRHFETTEVYLIKLHGSIDWAQVRATRRDYYSTDHLATLKELQFAEHVRRHALPTRKKYPDSIVRVRATPINTAWQRLRSRAREPSMVTMATGKADDLGPCARSGATRTELSAEQRRSTSWAIRCHPMTSKFAPCCGRVFSADRRTLSSQFATRPPTYIIEFAISWTSKPSPTTSRSRPTRRHLHGQLAP